MLSQHRVRQEEIERRLLESFVEQAGFAVDSTTHERPDANERFSGPDLVLSGDLGNGDGRYGIELTEYQADWVPGGGSPMRRKSDLLWKIGDALWRRCSDDPLFRNVTGTTRLMLGRPLPKKQEIPPLVDEVMCWLESNRGELAKGEHVRTRSHSPVGVPLFETGSLFAKYLNSINARHMEMRLRWNMTAAAHVGWNHGCLMEIARTKRKKAARYQREGLDGLALLICATGTTPVDAFGCFPHIEQRVQASARWDVWNGCGFDRVILWDRTHRWAADIFPAYRLLFDEFELQTVDS